MPILEILSDFTPLGGSPAVTATREPEIGEIVRAPQGGGFAEFYWTAPAAATPVAQAAVLTPSDFVDLINAELDDEATVALIESTADKMKILRFKMQIAQKGISKAMGAVFLRVVVDIGDLMTAQQRTSILAAWPTA